LVVTSKVMSKKMSGDGETSHPANNHSSEATVVLNDRTLHDGEAKAVAEDAGVESGTVRKPLKLSTVSHTLDAEIAERLRHFAFRERISESAVIEFSLRGFFDGGDDPQLGQQLRDRGAGLRRKS
jgi:hypothetical protein